MSRPVVLSNGQFHVGINDFGLVHDFYFPYVGLENHSAGRDSQHRIGVWVDGQFSWFRENSDDWQLTFSYPYNALIGHIVAHNSKLGVMLEFDDAIDAKQNVLMRNIHIVNTHNEKREIRLFMHQAFAIGDSRSNTDTGQYLPDSNAIVHYRGNRAFVVSGLQNEDEYFDQYSIGLFDIEGREGTWRDAEDGELGMGNVEHGRIDSTIRFRLVLDGNDSGRVNYWITAGTSIREALDAHKQIESDTIASRIVATQGWWYQWLEPILKVVDRIDPEYRDNFVRSALIVKSQIDDRGAVIASTDSAMLNYSRDAYAYCWPRDGAYVLWPLIRLGYTDEPLNFFQFCKEVLHPAGYLMHKFRADGALGSSWHPYIHDDIVAAPIQEDETALTLFVFAQYYQLHKDPEILAEFYDDMVVPMANFLASYIDEDTGLPKPSYDLWEEVFLTTTYSTSVTYAALEAAAELAEANNDHENAVAWRASANDIRAAAVKYLYNPDRKAFYKGVLPKDGELVYNDTLDSSSVFGAFMFGLFAVDSEELTNAVSTLLETFTTEEKPYGLPRYENDYYQRVEGVTGNWWYITSLWLAQFYAEQDNIDEAKRIVDWVQTSVQSTGVMSEQLNPHTSEQLSVAPLTWSHAEFLATMLDMIAKPDEEL